MQVILSGKSIDSKEEQPLNVEPLLNVESPIILIEFGKFIFCRRELYGNNIFNNFDYLYKHIGYCHRNSILLQIYRKENKNSIDCL